MQYLLSGLNRLGPDTLNSHPIPGFTLTSNFQYFTSKDQHLYSPKNQKSARCFVDWLQKRKRINNNNNNKKAEEACVYVHACVHACMLVCVCVCVCVHAWGTRLSTTSRAVVVVDGHVSDWLQWSSDRFPWTTFTTLHWLQKNRSVGITPVLKKKCLVWSLQCIPYVHTLTQMHWN